MGYRHGLAQPSIARQSPRPSPFSISFNTVGKHGQKPQAPCAGLPRAPPLQTGGRDTTRAATRGPSYLNAPWRIDVQHLERRFPPPTPPHFASTPSPPPSP